MTLKEITSYQVDLTYQLTTHEMMKLYHYVSKSEYDVYLYQNGQVADAGNFPKMLSFFLIATSKKPLVIVIDGEKPDEGYRHIKQLLNKNVKQAKIRNRHKVEVDNDISFVI
ncbi:hypothetical protein SAMN05216244_0795 [Sediminibacillus halophilus]|uniref:Uncharacterized protein n=1 Tax=Sediminibacillus halophilus TaxID=482461 RepID=A0A1G9MZV4_9BACI|nr:hypothetical protein SAMN05216244_0795 [Sediminibacillus halophilus]